MLLYPAHDKMHPRAEEGLVSRVDTDLIQQVTGIPAPWDGSLGRPASTGMIPAGRNLALESSGYRNGKLFLAVIRRSLVFQCACRAVVPVAPSCLSRLSRRERLPN